MAHKAADLRLAMQSKAGRGVGGSKPAATTAVERANPDNPHYRPGRASKTNITGYFDKAVKVQLKTIGLETGDRTIQTLLVEALNDLFVKYKKPEIAQVDER